MYWLHHCCNLCSDWPPDYWGCFLPRYWEIFWAQGRLDQPSSALSWWTDAQSQFDYWSFSSSQYGQAAVKNIEEHLDGSNLKLVTWLETPVSTLYCSEVVSPELNVADAAYYQSLIGGILQWMAELGRVDICMEVSMMVLNLLPWSNAVSIFLDNDRNYERWEYHVNCLHTFWTNLSCTIL